MSDLRQGVSEAVHGVLDTLDRCGPGWAHLDEAGVLTEVALAAATVDAAAREQRAAGHALARLAALSLHLLERAAA